NMTTVESQRLCTYIALPLQLNRDVKTVLWRGDKTRINLLKHNYLVINKIQNDPRMACFRQKNTPS
ncbi:hypothetical protein, partial [Hallella multisaccharivorax]|uniref:hypothetical protein n=1 Tax=Hallella multisaccharivorax TaxID=310514 RepID=UPI00361E0005